LRTVTEETAGVASEAHLAPVLTPHGHLVLRVDGEGSPLESRLAARLQESFGRGTGDGLVDLGAALVGTPLPPVFGFWRDFAARYFSAVCATPDSGGSQLPKRIPAPPPEVLESLVASLPPMTGAEYATTQLLGTLWGELEAAFHAQLAASRLSIQEFLRTRNAVWNRVGRVHFNLAENRKDEEAPFAFLATYTPRLTAQGATQHLPLGEALREYARATDREKLLSLLLPVHRAAEKCGWLKEMVDAGEIFHALRWSVKEAYQLLTDVPALESAGVVIRAPGSWSGGRPPRPKVSATVGSRAAAGVGMDALLDFRAEVTLDGEALTAAEIRKLLAGTEGLALIRGRWVEVDRERLERMLETF